MRGYNISTSISRILATTVLAFVLIGTLQGLYKYDETKYREAKYLEQVDYVKSMQWNLIESVITDNYNNADLFANGIKLNVERRLIDAYPNRLQLQEDLINPDNRAIAYSIFSQELKGKYLNDIKNDNNDPFIASKTGILSDLSLNCSGTQTSRSWANEISFHTNKQLASKATNAIAMQVISRPIFWEFQTSSNPNHIMITEMDMREIRNVFMEEGLEGLETYEFLKPVYIQQNTDIFGMPDVNSIGMRQSNSKLIVVSGFNICDIMNTYHKSAINRYNNTLQLLEKDHLDMIHRSTFIYMIFCVIVIFCIITTMVLNNYVVSVMQKESEYKVDDPEIKV